MYKYIQSMSVFSNKQITKTYLSSSSKAKSTNLTKTTNLNWYEIRDYIIPNNQIKLFENYLLTNNKISQSDMETFLGTGIAEANSIIVSMCNLYLRESDIKINRSNVLEQIYWANCRKHSRANPDCMINWCSFDDCIEKEYIHMYWNIFD
jgi:hypothetical protein